MDAIEKWDWTFFENKNNKTTRARQKANILTNKFTFSWKKSFNVNSMDRFKVRCNATKRPARCSYMHTKSTALPQNQRKKQSYVRNVPCAKCGCHETHYPFTVTLCILTFYLKCVFEPIFPVIDKTTIKTGRYYQSSLGNTPTGFQTAKHQQ